MLPKPGTISAVLIVNCLVLYCLNYVVPNAADMLGLVTANTVLWNKYVWNVVTAAFYEESFVKCLIDIVCILYVTPSGHIDYLPVDQFALYLFICVLLSSLATSTYCLIRLFSTGREAMVLEPIYGASGVIIALTMYCRKNLGKTSILGLYKGDKTGTTEGGNDPAQSGSAITAVLNGITFDTLPPLIICTLLFLWFIRERWLALDTPFAICSMLISWSYLRFFYRNEDGSYGTPQDEFAFVAMFPEPLHVVLVPLTTAFYNLTSLTGLFPPLPKTPDTLPSYSRGHHLRGPHLSELNSSSGIVLSHDTSLRSSSAFSSASATSNRIGASSSGAAAAGVDSDPAAAAALASSNAVTERRRAKALKLLDAKMAEASGNTSSSTGAASESIARSGSGSNVASPNNNFNKD